MNTPPIVSGDVSDDGKTIGLHAASALAERRMSLLPALLAVALTTPVLMFLFALVEQPSFPLIRVWESHSATIAFSTMITTVAGWLVLRANERAKERIRKNGLEFQAMFEHSAMGMALLNPDGRITRTNRALQQMLVCAEEELCGKHFTHFTHADDAPAARIAFEELMAGRHEQYRAERRSHCGNGNVIEMRLTISVVRGPAGEPQSVVAMIEDVTEHKETQAELARERDLLRALMDNATDLIFFKDLQSRFISCSKSLGELLGSPPEKLVGKSDFEYHTEECARKFLEDEQTIIRTGKPLPATVEENVTKGGKVTWFLTAKMPLRDKTNAIIGTFGICKDITAMKEAEEKLRFSEMRFHSVWERSSEGMRLTDEQGTMLAVNPAFCQTVGLPAEELVGRPYTAIYAGSEDVANMIRKYQQRFAQRTIEPRLERRVSYRSGKTAEVEISNSFVEIERDRTLLLSIGRDITARKQTEAELTHERELLRSLMEHSPDCIYFKDRQSRFLRCSKALCERFGATPEGVAGKTDFDFFDESHARDAFEDEQRILRTGVPLHGKVELEIVKDGAEQWALTSKMPLRDKAGTIIGTFGISKDITAIKVAEANLGEVHRQLVDASRKAGMAEVATSVLHNVGNVLNSVNVSATLVVDAVTNSKAKNIGCLAALISEHKDRLPEFFASDPKGRQVPDYLNYLATEFTREQAELLKEMQLTRKNIEHIKDIVMMQQTYAKISGVVEKVNPVELVEDALRMNASALARHEVQVIRDFAPDVAEITAEKHKILQILVNLIANAKYACDESGRTDKAMTLELRNRNGSVQFSVIDNGVGVARENMSLIFNHGFTTRKGGHGFGLHSGALAAREMGGALTAYSNGPGTGARFTLEVPVEPTSAHE